MINQLDQNRFYVYGLFHHGIPFYIGKGNGNRAYDHIGEARRGSIRPVHKKIRSMQNDPEVKILANHLSEEDAYELEELTIKSVGRRYDNTGPLLNLSCGGIGGTAGYVVKLTPDQIEKKNKALASTEVRSRISKGVKSSCRTLTEEGRKKIIATHSGKILSCETRKKISEAKKGICNYVPDEDQRKAISERLKGRKVSNATRRRISEGVKKHGGLTAVQSEKQRKSVLKQVICPHCDKIGAHSIMMRWHFDNCRFKTGENNDH